MTAYTITIGDGMCARAVGAEAVADALRDAVTTQPFDVSVIQVGCDGSCWAQPVMTVYGDGGTRVGRFERVNRDDVSGIMARLGEADRRAGAAMTAGPPPDRDSRQSRRLLARCGVVDPEAVPDAASGRAPYAGLAVAATMEPDAVVDLVREAGLRGRGGAYFPIALKWQSARLNPAPRYLVVNAEEGEPGAFKDRHLMEGDPHLLVEGIAIAAHAIECDRVFLYINGQAELSAARMRRAIDRAAPLVAAHLGRPLAIEMYRGAGGYVCGEESVILNSIEGERAVPRTRPPLPVDAGLWGRPTVISNVETLCNLPLILTEGVAAFRQPGTAEYPGTKLVSISGAVQRPGLYEVPIGVSTRSLLDLAGGIEPGHTLRSVVMGGPSGGFLSPDLLDQPLTGGLIHPSGAVLGSGGVVVLDDRLPLSAALRDLTAYNVAESCGKCTPCREGSARALDVLTAAGASGTLDDDQRQTLLELCDVLQYASLCGLGQMAPGPIRSALALFP